MLNFKKVIIGMEPTGHYWKSCARYLKQIDWMEFVTLNNGVKMPKAGFRVYQISKDECEECVFNAIKVGYYINLLQIIMEHFRRFV